MKVQVSAFLVLALACCVSAQATWSFKKFQDGVEVPLEQGPATELRSATLQKLKRIRNLPRRARANVDNPNDCGAAVTGTGFTSIVGTWNVPTIQTTGASPPGLLQWVGIDGLSETADAGIQGGTLSEIQDGAQVNFAYVDMLPAALQQAMLTVETADTITTNITTTSTTSGVITLSNETRGTSIVATVSGGTALSRTSAEWILQIAETSNLAPVLFSSVTVTGSAIASGTTVSLSKASVVSNFNSDCTAKLVGTTLEITDGSGGGGF
ncbi:Acid proteinase A [Mycena chlorophos]|uniref:Acid proteinase A n=1 Tax=Mycena chlorophos TaxID=658473 RepID=A0A8H6STY0_MYCCL|nr:Acid proteinase A [Mycena chlorophos]